MHYRGYVIEYNPPPIPLRNWDWQYAHEEYDGPGDRRSGAAASLDAAKQEIDELVAEMEQPAIWLQACLGMLAGVSLREAIEVVGKMRASLENYMTVEQAATKLKMTPSYIRQLIRKGKLRADRIGARTWLLKEESVLRFEKLPRRGPGRPKKLC